jgi:hypothetical protein
VAFRRSSKATDEYVVLGIGAASVRMFNPGASIGRCRVHLIGAAVAGCTIKISIVTSIDVACNI